MKYSCIKKCYLCNSILEVEESDINIYYDFKTFYICPVCNNKNNIEIPNSITIKKLDNIKMKLCKIYDNIYLVN